MHHINITYQIRMPIKPEKIFSSFLYLYEFNISNKLTIRPLAVLQYLTQHHINVPNTKMDKSIYDTPPSSRSLKHRSKTVVNSTPGMQSITGGDDKSLGFIMQYTREAGACCGCRNLICSDAMAKLGSKAQHNQNLSS